MYPGLKTEFARIISSTQYNLTENYVAMGDLRSEHFIVMDNNTEIIRITKVTKPCYIDDENYETGQVSRIHHRDEYEYSVTVPKTGFKSQPTDTHDCQDLYSLCLARKEFDANVANRTTMRFLAQHQK